MCEAHLAGTRRAAAAHKARRTYRMMRRAERAVAHKPAAAGQRATREYTFVVPQPPCGESGGRMPGRRLCMDFPVPGAPINKILWPPAARSPWRAGLSAGPGHRQSPVRPRPAGKGRGLCRFYGRFARQMAHCVQRRMDRVAQSAPAGLRPPAAFRRNRTGGARPAAPRPAPYQATRPSHCARRRPAKAR